MRLVPTALVIPFLIASCTSDSGDAAPAGSTPAEVATAAAPPPAEWRLSAEPLVSIGVQEGAPEYQLHDVQAAALLPDGRVVVGDQGSMEVRVYAADGTFLRAQGGRGPGPGEWRNFLEIRPVGGDTVAVYDRRNGWVGLVDVATAEYHGEVDEAREAELIGQVRLRRGLLVDAPLAADEMAVLAPVLSALEPRDRTAPTFVVANPDGKVWVRSAPRAPAAGLRLFDLEGREHGFLRVTPDFEPLAVHGDRVVGLWKDELDVEYVRIHALEGAAPEWSGPSLEEALATRSGPLPPVPEVVGEMLDPVKSFVKNMAMLEEIYYSDNYSYTTDMDALLEGRDVELPEGVRIEVLAAAPSGWRARFLKLDDGSGCYLSYGSFKPVEGAPPGAIACWGAGGG